MKKIILATTSPRRKEIFAKTGLPFETQESNYEENMKLPMSPSGLVKHLSLEKAKAVAEKNKGAIVIAADTFIVFKNKYVGKPKTKEEAKEMLKMLSGKEHQIVTGVTIIDSEVKHAVSFHETIKVFMKDFSDKTIDAYIETGEPLDKAGAYAIQGLGAVLIDRIEGDFFAAMGLPLSRLADELKGFGINVI